MRDIQTSSVKTLSGLSAAIASYRGANTCPHQMKAGAFTLQGINDGKHVIDVLLHVISSTSGGLASQKPRRSGATTRNPNSAIAGI